MRRFSAMARCWRCPFVRLHHLRALAILVTLLSLSLLFSTFTLQRYSSVMMVTDPDAPGPNSIDHEPTTTAFKSIIKYHPAHQHRSHHPYALPAPAALLRSRNLFTNRTLTREDINNTLDLLTKKLDEGKRELSKEFAGSDVPWNVTHPQRLLIVTSWRSGSTFLGQILSEHPGVFNHYEPLMHYGLQQIRPDDPEAERAVDHLRKLLQCKYANEDFIRKVNEDVQDMMSHNAQLWQACLLGPNRNACTSVPFLERSCTQFPTLTMKIVRLRLNLTRQLLNDGAALPGLKVVYLVRDPRATMNSRLLSVDWCNKSADCIDPARLCADLQNDLDAYEQLSTLHPGRMSLIKYEALARDPHAAFRQVFEFAGLFYTRRIGEVVERHTSRDDDHPWSTVRKSAERVDRWQTKLDRQTISDIQAVCSNVLVRLGYPLL